MEDSEGSRCDSPVYPCPSFNSYTSGGLAEVASRVCREEELGSKTELASADSSAGDHGGDCHEEEDDFEFVSLVENPDQVLISGGYARPVFPVFNRDLLSGGGGRETSHLGEDENEDERSIMIPLKNLFLEDRDAPSCSSSEADELEGVPEGTYCVWTPRSPAVEQSPSRCKKSNSTGSCSKRWRLRDLMRRSNSDGKDSFVFLTPSSSSSPTAKSPDSKAPGAAGPKEKKSPTGAEAKIPARPGNSSKPAKEKASSASAHEAFYVRNRAMKEGDRKRSYLPYRKDLVGFFATASGLGRNFPPF
ncbi:hypothetical protein CDL15_Pgr005726 [Punica granatum]|nr:hypothetical protein CDL15_Pgr005726 [Punica granatum]PKI79209.1 hypothetical protein CRG98_000501 [Punica granatum]